MRYLIDVHSLASHYQGELDDLLGIGREPAQVIEFPTARITPSRLVGRPAQP